jgi:hypothetical protein
MICGLGAVGASSIFGLVRRAGAFAAVHSTFVLVSRMQLAQQYRGNGHFLSAASSSRHKAMVGALARASAHSWISRLLTSSLSLGISSLFCRATQFIFVRHVDSSTLAFSLSSCTDPHS